MSERKSVFKDFQEGFKSLLCRNAILIILINSLHMYGNTMKNGFRTLIGAQDLGLAPEIIGLAVSVFMVGGLVARAPSGAITDMLRAKLRLILPAAFIIKAICWCGFILVSNPATYYVLFFFDGIIWSFAGTVLPAVLAISIDRRVMGTGYALMIGITNIATASARSTGISLYTESGIKSAIMVAGATAVCAAILTLFLDFKSTVTSSEIQSKKANAPVQKKGLLAGICVSMIPLCFVANMAYSLFTMESNYLQVYCQAQGFSYLGATTLGFTILGVLMLVMGVLCDLMNPAILIIIALAGQVVAPFMWATATSSAVISAGVLIYYSTRYFEVCFRALAAKSVLKSEQGAVSATLMIGFDIINIASALILGVVISQFGYKFAFIGLGIWDAIALISFVILNATVLKRQREKLALETATVGAN